MFDETAILHCYNCDKENQVEVIEQVGYWHWGRGKHARGWNTEDAEMTYSEARQTNIIFGLFGK